MEGDHFGSDASKEARNVGQDLCSSFILPSDHELYNTIDFVTVCSDLLGHLSLVCHSLPFKFLLSLFLGTNFYLRASYSLGYESGEGKEYGVEATPIPIILLVT